MRLERPSSSNNAWPKSIASRRRRRVLCSGSVFTLGDLIVDGEDLYGDGVNVAARLEGEAPAGGILVSRTVKEAVEGRLKATFQDLGALKLKNIERPMRTFQVAWNTADWPLLLKAAPLSPAMSAPPGEFQPADGAIRQAIDRSAAVRTTCRKTPEQEHFADGVVEALTAALSHIRSFFVVARNSAFTYKGRSTNVRDVGRELGVAYVLEGSVQRSGSRVRITVQLIETAEGAHLWAEKYDGSLDDIFDLQDRITEQVAGALQTVDPAGGDRACAAQTPPRSWSLRSYHAGDASRLLLDKTEAALGLPLLEQALEIDKDYLWPWRWSAWCWAQQSRLQLDRRHRRRPSTRVATRRPGSRSIRRRSVDLAFSSWAQCTRLRATTEWRVSCWNGRSRSIPMRHGPIAASAGSTCTPTGRMKPGTISRRRFD